MSLQTISVVPFERTRANGNVVWAKHNVALRWHYSLANAVLEGARERVVEFFSKHIIEFYWIYLQHRRIKGVVFEKYEVHFVVSSIPKIDHFPIIAEYATEHRWYELARRIYFLNFW